MHLAPPRRYAIGGCFYCGESDVCCIGIPPCTVVCRGCMEGGRRRGREEGEEWRKTVESIKSLLRQTEISAVFRKNPSLRVRIIRKLDRIARKEHIDATILDSVKRFVNEFCTLILGERFFRDEWANELDGKTEVRLSSGIADIATTTHVYEVERVNYWKHGIEQVMRYARESGLKPALALFGHAPTPIAMAKIKREAARLGIDLLLKLWE